MQPNDENNQKNDINDTASSRQAATNIIRSQIDNIFDKQDNNNADALPNTQAEKWKQYHSAWQTYYQKYYEGYYQNKYKNQGQNESYWTQTPPTDQPETNQTDKAKPLTDAEAISDIKEKLRKKISDKTNHIKSSNHFKPIIAGLFVTLLFAFVQYNGYIFSKITAFISPGNIDVQNIIVDPSTTVTVSAESRIIIPKINVDAPVSYDIGNDYDSQMAAMQKGLAHFAVEGANSHPGQVGNTVIAGHSSNDLFDVGDYKFIFVQLDKLVAGDTIYANYQSTRYTYVVTEKKVVSPTDIASLNTGTDKPMLTLLTCTPIGTAKSRLLVFATQVSPDPAASAAANSQASTTSSTIPGKQKTLLERLFSLFSNNKY